MKNYFKGVNFSFDLSKKTYIMGILNLTPDSFSDGGRFNNPSVAFEHAKKMLCDGADIIDIGGESTRPNFTPVDDEQELFRVIPVIEKLKSIPNIVISIDTSKPIVAKKALEYGADIINDVTGFSNPLMFELLCSTDASAIAMDCSDNPNAYFNSFAAKLHQHNIDIQRVCLDVGIGFGKTSQQNIEVIKNIPNLNTHNMALMLACSRKSFIPFICGSSATIDQRLAGTIAAQCYGIANGVNIIRVHDVFEAAQSVAIMDSLVR